MVARRNWTREWWERAFEQGDELVTSNTVLNELMKGEYDSMNNCLELISTLPLLDSAEEIKEIVKVYLSHRFMPKVPTGDVLHLAFASFHNCDALVTWNCQHLANARKFRQLSRLNSIMGLAIPSLVTPMNLLEVSGDE